MGNIIIYIYIITILYKYYIYIYLFNIIIYLSFFIDEWIITHLSMSEKNSKINHLQSSNCISRATPLLIQWSESTMDFKSKYITKLVEWPVVDNVPLRVEVLYKGHLYPIALYSSTNTGSSL